MDGRGAFVFAALSVALGGCGIGEIPPKSFTEEVQIEFYDAEGVLEEVHYRFSGDVWRAASLESKTLRLRSEDPSLPFEVVASCGPSYHYPEGQVLFLRATAGEVQNLRLPCSLPHPYKGQVSTPIAVSFPSILGGVPLASDDAFTFDGSSGGQVAPGGTQVAYLGLPPGPQKASLLVYRGYGSGATLLGGKVFDLVVEEGRGVTANLSDLRTVVTRPLIETLPRGVSGTVDLLYFKDGMRRYFAATPSYATIQGTEAGRYAVFPGHGGVYLGRLNVHLSYLRSGSLCAQECSSQVLLLEDTRGLDWAPGLPSAWGPGQLQVSPDGRTWELRHPGAQGYEVHVRGLLYRGTEALPLAFWTTSSLTLPELPSSLGVRYAASGEVFFSILAVKKGGLDALGAALAFQETSLSGLSFTSATLSGAQFVLGVGGSL